MEEVAFLNGRFMPLSEACVSVNDRGFLFGDAIYEVARAYGGRVWALDRHLSRLARSLDAIDISGVEIADVRANLIEAHRRSGVGDALIYLQITRGVAPRSHMPKEGMVPTVLVTVRRHEGFPAEMWRDGVRAALHPEPRWKRPDLKYTNLLPKSLARRAAHARGASEAIFVTDAGWVDEGTSSNVLLVSAGVLRTPPKSHALLPGVTRDLVVETAQREGIPVEEVPVSREALLAADEVILTSTGVEVLGVVQLDDTVIGAGAIGPVTRRLHAAYLARIAAGDD